MNNKSITLWHPINSILKISKTKDSVRYDIGYGPRVLPLNNQNEIDHVYNKLVSDALKNGFKECKE